MPAQTLHQCLRDGILAHPQMSSRGTHRVQRHGGLLELLLLGWLGSVAPPMGLYLICRADGLRRLLRRLHSAASKQVRPERHGAVGIRLTYSAVMTLDLGHNSLSGTMPPQLGNLALEYLSLSANSLSGTLPPQLGSLTALRYLYLGGFLLQGDGLSGTLPPQLASLTALKALSVDQSRLSGTVPLQLGKLTAMRRLYLYDNDLTGSVPPQLGTLTALAGLRLNGNDLSGTVPPQLGSLTALEYL